jgi:hypothetical protein
MRKRSSLETPTGCASTDGRTPINGWAGQTHRGIRSDAGESQSRQTQVAARENVYECSVTTQAVYTVGYVGPSDNRHAPFGHGSRRPGGGARRKTCHIRQPSLTRSSSKPNLPRRPHPICSTSTVRYDAQPVRSTAMMATPGETCTARGGGGLPCAGRLLRFTAARRAARHHQCRTCIRCRACAA